MHKSTLLDKLYIEKNLNMRFLLYTLVLLLTSSSTTILAQDISPKEIINRSIQYHDPKGMVLKKEMTLNMTETRPNGSDRKSTIAFDIKGEAFEMTRIIDGIKIESELEKDKASFIVAGSKEISSDHVEKYRLTKERLVMMKNYYQYLWAMPMKLNDPGTNYNPLVKKVDFFGKESLEIRVTYDPGVGGDVWYFYFNPSSFALQGYRFYHDEEKNDGEYIVLEDEVIHKHVRLPKARKWYTHKEDKFLGADILDSFVF